MSSQVAHHDGRHGLPRLAEWVPEVVTRPGAEALFATAEQVLRAAEVLVAQAGE